MSFLSPLFLLAAAAVAVPLFLHLFHRHESRKLVFPALRYLLRTEREHARRIRFRQLVLLLARIALVLLLVAAGARLLVRGRGADHEATGLVVVLDNSMSSGRVIGQRRVLDLLKARARESLEATGPEDRVWVIRAGEPWAVASPTSRAEARERLDATEPSAARADLTEAVARARRLAGSADLAAAEVHLLSDAQRTAFSTAGSPTGTGERRVPVVTFLAPPPESDNRFVQDIVVGGGLPPLSGQRTDIAVRIGGVRNLDAEPVPVRLVAGGRIRAAGSARPGEELVLPAGPFSGGTVDGYAEIDPDPLRADDRRFFVFTARPPVRLTTEGELPIFLEEGLGVLEEAGRVTRSRDARSEVLVAVSGVGLDAPGTVPAIVFPPPDPTLLPALNRRLASAGIPWRYEPPEGTGSVTVRENRLPVEMEGVTATRYYRLVPVEDASAGDVPARFTTGDPFLVTGGPSPRRYLLAAVPADPEWTDLPVSASMLPLLEWATSRWAASDEGGPPRLAGEEIPTPPGATRVRTPGGRTLPVDGARSFRETREAGIYEILAGDEVAERVAVNPPSRESLLSPLEPPEIERRLGGEVVVVDDPDDWAREIFRVRKGPELWRPLLAAALLLLLLESWIAASGSGTSTDRGTGGARTKESSARPAGTSPEARGERGGPAPTVTVGSERT